MFIKVAKKTALYAVIISLFLSLTACSTYPSKQNSTQQADQSIPTKEKIASQLNSNKEIFEVKWSSDLSRVVYIQTGKPEKNGRDEAYYWKVGEENPKFIRDVSPTTHGFTWSPNSQAFLISEKLGDGSINSIVQADSLKEAEYKIKSISIPVWSSDSMFIAYGNEQHDYGESWGSLEIYQLGQAKADYLWKAKNTLYKVDKWDSEGLISYTEINNKGQESKKTTKNMRPSISGVHLGDTKEQVIKALGDAYKETPPGEETMHFPEQVYRWTYEKGYTVFIGKDSGKVLEIVATSTEAATNLGAKIGDQSDKVFALYRPKYIEPESIHGGKLYGLFKVEGAAALFFKFDLEEGAQLKDIKPENKVTTMILTYPEILDDSF